MALQSWTVLQFEKMIDRVNQVKLMMLKNFSVLVSELKLEFEMKSLKLGEVHVFGDALPTEAHQSEIQELLEEMSLDLHAYCKKMQQEVSGSPKRSEIFQAGVKQMKEMLNAQQQALAVENAKIFSCDENSKADLTKRVEFLLQCVNKDEAAIVTSLRVEQKMESTPKRRKLASSETVLMSMKDDQTTATELHLVRS